MRNSKAKAYHWRTPVSNPVPLAGRLRLLAFILLGVLGGVAQATSCPLPSATDGAYDVTSRTDLEAIGSTCPMDGTYRLTNDVDLSGTDWIPIGWAASSTDVVPFTGTLHGQGYAITHLTIDGSSTVNDAGLFSRLEGATIRSLSLKDVRIEQAGFTSPGVGGLAGGVSSTEIALVRDVTVTGVVKDNSNNPADEIGGMFGFTQGPTRIERSHVLVNVRGKDGVGGVVGRSRSTIAFTNVRVNGDTEGGDDVGGFVGRNDGDLLTIENATLTSTADVDADDNVGGVVGHVTSGVETYLTNITVDGEIGDNSKVGGIIGNLNGGMTLLENVTVTGTVDGDSDSGGLIGYADSSITLTDISINADAEIVGTSDVGGLVGHVAYSTNVRASRVTVAGHIEGTSPIGRVGGLFGRLYDHENTVNVTNVEIAPAAWVKGTKGVGGLIGQIYGKETDPKRFVFSDLTVDGLVHGTEGIGGAFGDVSEATELHRARIVAQVSGTAGSVGGVAGEVGRSDGALTITETLFEGEVSGEGSGDGTGGLVGAYYQGADALSMRDVLVVGPTTSTAVTDVGGLIGHININKDADLRRALVLGPLTTTSGTPGTLVGKVDGSTVSVTDAFWSTTTNPNAPAIGSGTVTGNARGEPTATLQTYATFTEAGWSIANGRPAVEGPADATWTLCRDGTPTLTRWAPERCLPASNDVATFRVGGFDPRQLRNIPFDVAISLTDAEGDAAYTEAPSTLTLVANGGAEGGDLLTYPEDASAPTTPQVTVPAGTAHVTFTDVFYTGLSGPDGRDVTLTATGEDGPLEGIQVSTTDLAVRDVAMTLGVSPTTLLLNGADVATVTVTLTDAKGTPLDGEPITLTTTSGGLGPDATPTLVRRTNREGRIQATLTPTRRAGTATLTARCPGACPRTTTITFTGEIDDLRAVPGDQEAWLYFAPLADDVTNVRYRIDKGPWIAADPPRTRGPLHVTPDAAGTDLRNGVPHVVELQGLERNQTTSDLPIAGPITVTPTDVEPPDATWARIEGGEVDAGIEGDRTRVTLDASLTNETGGPLREVWIDTPPQDAWSLGELRVTNAEQRTNHGIVVEREEAGWRVRFTRTPLLAGDTLELTLDLDERSDR
ncbi:MAG: invasin domain 3-containing protein [Trueperaceae bacterium]|nr:invasin domain 3-containing protein [Trueperaceae bacterium]